MERTGREGRGGGEGRQGKSRKWGEGREGQRQGGVQEKEKEAQQKQKPRDQEEGREREGDRGRGRARKEGEKQRLEGDRRGGGGERGDSKVWGQTSHSQDLSLSPGRAAASPLLGLSLLP